MSIFLQDSQFWSNRYTEDSTLEATSATIIITSLKVPEEGHWVFTVRRKVENNNYAGSTISHFSQCWETKPPLKWFWCDCSTFKLKVVLNYRQ